MQKHQNWQFQKHQEPLWIAYTRHSCKTKYFREYRKKILIVAKYIVEVKINIVFLELHLH